MRSKVIKSMKDAFSMTKQRCYNPNCRDYKYYGARGIRICDRWLESFDNYLADMGLRPDGMTLERKDNDGDYSPENCVWATRAAQSRNTRQNVHITYKGKTLTIAEWENLLGFNPGTLNARINDLGYSIEDAMSKPVKPGGLLQGKEYQHIVDQSWRTTDAMRKAHLPPKLSQDEVGMMRALHQEVAMTFTMLGKLFSVSTETASNAVQGISSYKGY